MLAANLEGVHFFVLEFEVVIGIGAVVAGRKRLPGYAGEGTGGQIAGFAIIGIREATALEALGEAGIEHAVFAGIPLDVD